MKNLRTVHIRVKLEIEATSQASAERIVNEADYNFSDTTGQGKIIDTEIVEIEGEV
jgi:hypothetical protein